MFHRFRFESDCYPTLSRIPLYVRMKLDLTGIKISLNDWLSFGFEERTALCHLPVDLEDEKDAFRSYLHYLSRKYRGAPAPATAPVSSSLWDDPSLVPQPVADKKLGNSEPVTINEWASFASYQRYALYKTAISKNEPGEFFAVLSQLRDEAAARPRN
jgi:hypothetical protein